jgi:hypothetical protein
VFETWPFGFVTRNVDRPFPLRVASTRNEVLETFWISVPLNVLEPPLANTTATVKPAWNPVPEIVSICLVVLLVGLAGDTPLMTGGKAR